MMSSGVNKPGQQNKPGQGNLPGAVPSNLLDKLHARQSTPDSEALASSEDEGETHRQDQTPLVQPQKPVRRASWLNDISQASIRPRKDSFASSTMSPTTSHPSTPSAEVGSTTWGAHPNSAPGMGRPHAGSSALTWGTGIWNNERKEPPSRLAEVLPSPTSALSQGNHIYGSMDGGPTQTSPAPRDGQNPHIPFAIPLVPTPKAYRSQSYSVGQLDPETPNATTPVPPSAVHGSRGRPMPHSGLQHRPSKPSMLSEMSKDGRMLGKVKEDEDDDDDESPESTTQGGQPQTLESKTIEMLTRENAMLRQQQQYQAAAARNRQRGSTGAGYGIGNGYGLHEPVPEESSDYAVDEMDEMNEASELAAKRAMGRRMSEYGAGAFRSSFSLENKNIESVKKAFWQSSLGFGGMGDIPQSRRHSFADVPTRQPSIGSIGDQVLQHELGVQEIQHDYGGGYPENHMLASANAGYIGGGSGIPGSQQAMMSPYGSAYPSPYALQNQFANRPSSPHRNMYGMSQPRHTQKLHIVSFKCSRADVYYIQEGTGLSVKPGDLVIVEADRGTDLGTVAKDNLDWNQAKEAKEFYAEEQYKWLMMFSRNASGGQDGTGAGLMAASNGMHGSAVGGMGPPSQHHLQEPNSGELKPKLIKRLAQQHEVQALRDKEGNEAKAKRVCMQKVKEHGLNMEILDAEFQMDWKKLTFYYFADAYINFNSLVTDLFKIYKTRIWMSAINPASFASPAVGLQTPSGIGPGAVGMGRGAAPAPERRQNQQEQQPGFSSPAPTARGFQGTFAPPFISDRVAVPFSQPSYPYNNYGGFTNAARPAAGSYTSNIMQPGDHYSPGFSSTDYQLRSPFPAPQSRTPQQQNDQPISPLTTQNDWVEAFQGMSLNSR